MEEPRKYSYAGSVKSEISDELINVYLQRPVAGVFARLLFSTPVTPNQVTVFSTVLGIAGGIVLALPNASLPLAGVLFYFKDVFDSVDGQLARAKRLYSRRGRFLDSIGDFVAGLFLCAGIAAVLVSRGIAPASAVALSTASMLGVLLRVSYHVYYQSSFLHREKRYLNNRVVETMTEDDRKQDSLTLFLHRTFLLLYGWQDLLMQRIDRWSFGTKDGEQIEPAVADGWYSDRTALRLGGFLGYGTEYVVLTICFLYGWLWIYLAWTLAAANVIWVTAIAYRRLVVRRTVRDTAENGKRWK